MWSRKKGLEAVGAVGVGSWDLSLGLGLLQFSCMIRTVAAAFREKKNVVWVFQLDDFSLVDSGSKVPDQKVYPNNQKSGHQNYVQRTNHWCQFPSLR